MKTTNMVVEIVVGGLQTTIWVVLLVLNVFGYEGFSGIVLSNWLGLSILVLSLSYTLGVIFDKLWTRLGRRYDLKIRNDEGLSEKGELDRQRTYVFIQSEPAGQFLDSIRSRMRIARATFFNTMLIWFNLLYFIPTWLAPENKSIVQIFSIVLCCMIACVAGYSWLNLIRTYYKQLKAFYKTLREESADKLKNENSMGGKS